MMITDPIVIEWVKAQGEWIQWAAPILGIVSVIGIAQWLKSRNRRIVVIDDQTHSGR